MVRKAVQTKPIMDERSRQATFQKRGFELMKKAMELSVLCDCQIGLLMFDSSNKLVQYSSHDIDAVLLRYSEHHDPRETYTNKELLSVADNKDVNDKSAMSVPPQLQSPLAPSSAHNTLGQAAQRQHQQARRAQAEPQEKHHQRQQRHPQQPQQRDTQQKDPRQPEQKDPRQPKQKNPQYTQQHQKNPRQHQQNPQQQQRRPEQQTNDSKRHGRRPRNQESHEFAANQAQERLRDSQELQQKSWAELEQIDANLTELIEELDLILAGQIPNRKRVLLTEENLTKAMLRVDAIESGGDVAIRKKRKELIGRAEELLVKVDEFKHRTAEADDHNPSS